VLLRNFSKPTRSVTHFHAFVFLLGLICGACGAKRSTVVKESTMPVPTFQIRITLSEDAATELSDAEESIHGVVYFGGTRAGTDARDPSSWVELGSYQFETMEAGIISVSDAVISEGAFQQLKDPNYIYTIYVFSGGRVFKRNVLGGGYMTGLIGEAVKAPIEISCNLAAE